MGALRVCVSASAADRLSCARDLIRSCTPGTRVLIVGASRGAADDLAREVAASVPATFGLQRLSLTQLAAKTAILSLASEGVTTSTWLGTEAVAARVAFDARRDQALTYFGPVSGTPGFPRALARTLQELRLAGVAGRQLTGCRSPAAISRICSSASSVLCSRVECGSCAALSRRRARGRNVLRSPTWSCSWISPTSMPPSANWSARSSPACGHPWRRSQHGDHDSVSFLVQRGGVVEDRGADGNDDLACLRRFLFTRDALPVERALDGSLSCSPRQAKGASRSRSRDASSRKRVDGVRFDEMAILVRSPHSYFGLLEHALTRAGVPAWFDRGTDGRIPPAARFWRCSRARQRGCRRRGLPSISRLDRCRRSASAQPDVGRASGRDGQSRARMTTMDDRRRARCRTEQRDTDQRGCRHAAGAVALGEAARRSRRDRRRRRSMDAAARRQSEGARTAEARGAPGREAGRRGSRPSRT